MRVSGTADTWFPNVLVAFGRAGTYSLPLLNGMGSILTAIPSTKSKFEMHRLLSFFESPSHFWVFLSHHHPLPTVPHGTTPFSEFDGPIIFNQWKWGPTAPFLSTDCSLISISAEDSADKPSNLMILCKSRTLPTRLAWDVILALKRFDLWDPFGIPWKLTPRWISMAPLAGAMQSSGSDLWLVQDARWKGSAQGSARVYDAVWLERTGQHPFGPNMSPCDWESQRSAMRKFREPTLQHLRGSQGSQHLASFLTSGCSENGFLWGISLNQNFRRIEQRWQKTSEWCLFSNLSMLIHISKRATQVPLNPGLFY